MRLRDLAVDATRRFAAAGIDGPEAALDAELLLRHVLGWDRATWLTRLDERAGAETAAALAPLVRRREQREPMGYVRGVQEFYGREFAVGPGALVPRPETELVVDAGLAAIAPLAAPRVLDIGVGSGCLAVTVALERPDAGIAGTDISAAALAWTRGNAGRHGVAARIALREAAGVGGWPGPFDLVVSNPPYVRTGERASLPPEVARYEPETALYAGEDGLDVVRTIAGEVPGVLHDRGTLVLEIGAGQADAAATIVRAAGFETVQLCDDLQGIPRVVVARR